MVSQLLHVFKASNVVWSYTVLQRAKPNTSIVRQREIRGEGELHRNDKFSETYLGY